MFKILVLFPRFMYQVLEKVLELGARSQKRSQVQFLSCRKCTRSQVLNLGPKSQKMSQIQVRSTVILDRKELGLDLAQVLENVLDLVLGPRGSRSQKMVLRFRTYVPRIQVLGPRILGSRKVDLGDQDPRKWSQKSPSGPRIRLCPRKGPIQVLGPRFRSLVLEYVLGSILGPMSWKISQVYVLCPRIMSQVLEKFLELGSTSQKRSWVQSVGSRKGLRFRSIIPTFLSYVLVNLLDLGHRSKKCSQIQALCPKKVLDLVPRSQKRPRFRAQFLEKVLDLGPVSQIYVLGTGKGLRIRFSVLDLVLDLGPMPQVYVLRTGECPRIRFYVLDLILDLGPKFRKISYIQVLGPRIRSQVLENILDLGSRSQIQFLGPRKCLRFWSYFLGLCTRYWRRYQNQVLGPRKGPRFSS